MRTIVTTVYTFSELSDEAKEKAINDWRDSDIQFAWTYDTINSIKTIAKAINCIADWDSYDGINYCVWFTSRDDIEEISGKRAYAYIWNNYLYPNREYKTYWKDKMIHCDGRKNWKRVSKISYGWDDCPFTGYCADCCFIEAWREWKKEFNKYSTVSDFIELVAGKLGKQWTNDNEYQMTDEYISEILTINDYEFTEDGDRI